MYCCYLLHEIYIFQLVLWKDRKRFSHGTQVKKSTLPKNLEINKETVNIVLQTNTDLVITTTQSTVHCSANLDFLNTYKVPEPIQKKMKLSNNDLKSTITLTTYLNFWFRSYVHWAKSWCMYDSFSIWRSFSAIKTHPFRLTRFNIHFLFLKISGKFWTKLAKILKCKNFYCVIQNRLNSCQNNCKILLSQ